MTPIYIAAIIGLVILNIALVICMIFKFRRHKSDKPKRFNIIKFSKGIVITIFSLLIIYVITVLIIFICTNCEPVTLTENLFGFFKAEGGFLAIIKVAENTVERFMARKDKQNSESEIEEDSL